MADSLYIHIPYCISKCKYCDFFSVPCGNNLVPDIYVNALCNEIKYRLSQNKISKIDTIYIGGGTPSLLKEGQLLKIISIIKSYAELDKNYEFTIEANPDDINVDFIKWLNKTDVNRISCGIQTFNQKSLEFVNRRADSNVNKAALNLLKQNWDKVISIDVICGLPEEEKLTFLDTLKQIITIKPHHISMYSLTIEENTPLGKMLDQGKLDYNFENADLLWLDGKKLLEDNDYLNYEVSNFALKGFECKHNMKYWKHQNYIGAGSGATGTFYNKNGTAFRWTNSTDLSEYISFWSNENNLSDKKIPQNEENVSLEDSKFEFFMMGLRTMAGIKKSDYEKIFNEEIPSEIIKIMESWEKRDLFEIKKIEDDVIYTMGSKGILYLNRFLQEIII